MEFEENLNKMYQEIANKINEMIPVEWERVYTMAYMNEESEEVFLITLHLVVKNYITILLFLKNIVFLKIFDGLLDELYECFENSETYLKRKIKNHGHHVNLILIMKVN